MSCPISEDEKVYFLTKNGIPLLVRGAYWLTPNAETALKLALTVKAIPEEDKDGWEIKELKTNEEVDDFWIKYKEYYGHF